MLFVLCLYILFAMCCAVVFVYRQKGAERAKSGDPDLAIEAEARQLDTRALYEAGVKFDGSGFNKTAKCTK